MNNDQAKPYQRGKPVDGKTLKAAAFFFGGLLIMCLLSLILSGTSASIGAGWLRIAFCLIQVAVYYAMAFYSGLNRGSAAVALGETVLKHRNDGRDVSEAEIASCFHPLKGFVQAFLGTLPALAVTVAYAFMAQLQRTAPGTLPAFVSGMASRPDVLAPLTAYTQTQPAVVADYLRVGTRALIMPYVTMVGASSYADLLTLDRLSPLLCMLPAIAYGVGYAFGPWDRARVHENIAEGKRRLARKQRRERRQRRAEREPEKLN